MMGRNLTIAQAERRARNANKQKSHMQTVMRWAVFERYVLTYHPREPYADVIRKCRVLSLEAQPRERLRMQAPPPLLLLAYIMKLRKDDPDQERPDRRWSTIRALGQSAISSVLNEFSVAGKWPTHDVRVRAAC